MAEDLISLYRARLAREKGWVRKEWGGRRTIALAFPNVYRLGMSNLGFQVVYQHINRRPDVLAERVFLPEGREMSLYLQGGRPLLSLESQTPLHHFDLLAFSLSFENDYPNLLTILELGKLPLTAEDRGEGDPFVAAGGITTFLNPEPLAPLMDFFLLGEAEATLGAFLDRFVLLTGSGLPRNEVLKDLAASVPSLYAPSLYAVAYGKEGRIASFQPNSPGIPEKITTGRDLPLTAPPARSGIITTETEFGERPIVELGRGCGRSCRFCAAGFVYRPPRCHDPETLQAALEDILQTVPRVGLLAPCVSDIPGIEDLTKGIVERGAGFSVSSLRADALTPALLENLRGAGQKTVTIAPEAGSDRLRRVINKHLTRSQIHRAVECIARTGVFSLRLYFLMGLPTETHPDLIEMVHLVREVKHHMVKASTARGTIGQIRLSINCFVPKPFTPFQWFPLEEIRSLQAKQKLLRNAFAKEGGVKAVFDVPRWAYVQALLALGDRRVAAVLLAAHRNGGNWKSALKESEVNPDFFVARPKGLEEMLPWDFIDNGISKAYLRREYAMALRAEESEVCDVGDCRRCGVCRLGNGTGRDKDRPPRTAAHQSALTRDTAD